MQASGFQYISNRKDLYGGGGSIDPRSQYVGTVTNGGSFPTARPDGSSLVDGDYVKPLASSTFPFTISGVTFTNKQDKGIYVLNSNSWILDPGVVQDTAEIPVADKTVESITETATTQKAINIENVKNTKQKEFIFSTPSKIWNISHLLDKYPDIKLLKLVDGEWVEIYGTITYPTTNNIRVDFNSLESGKAIVN